jgi:hypothetical protein
MMQSCASAAKLRSGGPILPIGMKAKEHVGNPPPRTIIGSVTSVRTRPKLSGVNLRLQQRLHVPRFNTDHR